MTAYSKCYQACQVATEQTRETDITEILRRIWPISYKATCSYQHSFAYTKAAVMLQELLRI